MMINIWKNACDICTLRYQTMEALLDHIQMFKFSYEVCSSIMAMHQHNNHLKDLRPKAWFAPSIFVTTKPRP